MKGVASPERAALANAEDGCFSAFLSAANGTTLTAHYEYGPFGELLRATGPMAKANPFRFSTKYQDDETDLLYYGYRYYRASVGRWISRDPINESGGRNLYGFVRDDPTSRIDGLGLASIFCSDKCTKGMIRRVNVSDWGILPILNRGRPNTTEAAMAAPMNMGLSRSSFHSSPTASPG
jgi:RHS repeat-associated protein